MIWFYDLYRATFPEFYTFVRDISMRELMSLTNLQIMVFPEGTCTNRSCLITFKPGAFYPGVPVQPVLIRYNNRTDSFTWTWDGPGA